MQTPDTVAGQLTDKIMTSITEFAPLPIHHFTPEQYNRLWEYIHSLLRAAIPEKSA